MDILLILDNYLILFEGTSLLRTSQYSLLEANRYNVYEFFLSYIFHSYIILTNKK